MKKLICVAGLAALSTLATAAPLCLPGTLSTYVGLGADGCMLGSNTVSAFTVLAPITGATAISPNLISVSPINSSLNPGLTFTTSVTAEQNQIFQLLLMYQISGFGFTSDSVSLSGASSRGNGAVTEIQNSCLGARFVPDPPNPIGTCAGTDGTPLVVLNSGSDEATFSPVNLIAVLHDLTIDGGRGGSATGATVTDQFTASAVPPAGVIPEPSAILLMGSGLGLGILLKNSFKKAKK